MSRSSSVRSHARKMRVYWSGKPTPDSCAAAQRPCCAISHRLPFRPPKHRAGIELQQHDGRSNVALRIWTWRRGKAWSNGAVLCTGGPGAAPPRASLKRAVRGREENKGCNRGMNWLCIGGPAHSQAGKNNRAGTHSGRSARAAARPRRGWPKREGSRSKAQHGRSVLSARSVYSDRSSVLESTARPMTDRPLSTYTVWPVTAGRGVAGVAAGEHGR